MAWRQSGVRMVTLFIDVFKSHQMAMSRNVIRKLLITPGISFCEKSPGYSRYMELVFRLMNIIFPYYSRSTRTRMTFKLHIKFRAHAHIKYI